MTGTSLSRSTRARENPRLKAQSPRAPETSREAPPERGCSSVANLNAGPIPNAAIPIPNGGASGPVACRSYVHGSGRYVDGRWLIIARAARDRRSKQCTNCQSANNTGGYVAASCNRNPGCTRQTKTACDQQTNQKLAHFGPLRMEINVCKGLRPNYWQARDPPSPRAVRCKCQQMHMRLILLTFIPPVPISPGVGD
jgi:hypothetical protein